MEHRHRILMATRSELPPEFPSAEELQRCSELLLEELSRERGGSNAYELSLIIIDDEDMRQLNLEYRDRDASTDVLSFPFGFNDLEEEVAFPEVGDCVPLGDIVISHERASQQAASIGHSIVDEVQRLLVHGILHLFGYDHETNEEEADRMRELEDRLLALL